MKETQDNNIAEYRSIAKTNLVFGGVKLLQAFVSVLKIKIVAVFLGPTGMGLLSLIESALESIHMFTTFGIFTSGVREIAKSDKNNKYKTSLIVFILALILGIVGCIICILFSSQFSVFIFGTDKFKYWLVIAAFALIFKALSNGLISIFQGLRLINALAKSSLVGSIVALLICFPLYKFYGEEAIPYVVVFSFLSTALMHLIFIDKSVFKQSITFQNIITQSKPILKLGAILMISSCAMTLMIFLFNSFISKYGSQEDVGFYQASQGCTYNILSILIAILSADYYPKLSANTNDKPALSRIFNNQVELLIVATSLIVCFIILFPKFIIHLLYSSEFDRIFVPIQIMSIALIFRILWHSLSYIILAIGDKYTYLLYDTIIGNGLFFSFNVIGYLINGINGIAISYCVGSILTASILYLVVFFKYKIKISKNLVQLLLLSVLLIVALLLSSVLYSGQYYYIGIVAALFLVSYNIYVLQTKLGIFSLIGNKLINRNKNDK